MVRKCDHCTKVLVEFPRNDRQAEAHCGSSQCHWCVHDVRPAAWRGAAMSERGRAAWSI